MTLVPVGDNMNTDLRGFLSQRTTGDKMELLTDVRRLQTVHFVIIIDCYYLGRITHLQWQCWCVALDILPDTEKPIRTRNDKSGAIFVKLWQAHFFLCLFCLKYQLNCRYFYFSRTEHNNEINILISHFYNDVLNLAGPGLSCTCWWPTPTHWPFCLPSSPICIRTPRWRQLLHQPCTDGSIYFTWILNCLD